MDYTKEQSFGRAETRDRSIIKNVYLWMTAGLALTGVVAFGLSSNQSLMIALVSNRVLFFGIIIAEL
ncbi:MAG: BAX inhibitor (BI)-1/YccA family protein, partial [Spirochaetales bacterium]|nr:BAX inhibitor (BI)-1/YccA family protein [Spirochaetales bacterium]